MNKFTLILILFFGLFLQSCRSTKQVQTADTSTSTSTSTSTTNDQTVPDFIKLRTDFEWFSTNFSGSVNFDGNRNNISGQIRIKNGEQIWMTVAAMGGLIPVANLLVTTDSVFLHNRIEKTAMIRDFSFFKDVVGMDITFDMLQDILVGDFVYIDIPNSAYLYEFSDGNKLFIQVREPMPVELRLNYSKIQINVPQSMSFSIPNSVKRI
jgi:hypothetical protein